MKTIRLSRAVYRGLRCIFLEIEPDDEFYRLIRQYPGRIWSNSRRRWYIPDEEDSYRRITSYFGAHFHIDKRGLYKDDSNEKDKLSGENTPTPPGANREGNYPEKFGPVSMTISPQTGKMVIRFEGRFDREWISEIKHYGGAWYDPNTRQWSLPANKLVIDSISDYFNNLGVRLIIQKERQPEAVTKKRNKIGSEIRNRCLGEEAVQGIKLLSSHLREKRYSIHTINSYLSQLEFFFKYFNDRLPGEISDEDISAFINNYIITLGYSGSYQSQLIATIKTFYSLAGSEQIKIEKLKRPRKGRPLPQVFSREEVTRILNSTGNLKHQLILWIIYSCGLRRSEVINIRTVDLNRERGILHIRGGKGSVDRVVPVSEKVWQKVEQYKTAYQPGLYLFEGQNGGKYTAGSVYNIFKQALSRVGIEKEVGVHSLRHSYATHLHESGLDIRYIQELLGHRSSRTTEIYTHVSRRNLVSIRSPIDDLDLT